MKLGVDIPLETKISIKHKQEKKNNNNPLLPKIYGLKLISFHFLTSTWFVLDIWNVIRALEFH